MAEFIPFLMFLAACLVLMAGYPVAFSFVWHHGKYHVDCGAAVHLNGGDA
jgi:TRAP-type mannitol/chloroaromatic compound transport system permease large subunit